MNTKAKLQEEQDREELEKRRSGMPGAIRRSDALGIWWTRKRYDVADNNIALFREEAEKRRSGMLELD